MFARCVFRAAEDQFRAVRRQSLSGRRPGGAMERRAPMVAWMRARGVRVLLARLRVPSATVWQRCCESSSVCLPHTLRVAACSLRSVHVPPHKRAGACCIRGRCFVCMCWERRGVWPAGGGVRTADCGTRPERNAIRDGSIGNLIHGKRTNSRPREVSRI